MHPQSSQLLYAAGSNARGQLAIGHADDAHTFELCVFDPPLQPGSRILSVSCGANHTLAIVQSETTHHTLWSAGFTSRGQRGFISEDEAHVFRPLANPAEYAAMVPLHITCLWESSLVVLRGPERDVILSFGANDFGDLGRDANKTSDMQPVDLHQIVSQDATVRVAKIFSGPHHAVVLLDSEHERYVVGWGASRHGQLGALAASSKMAALPILIARNLLTDLEHIIGAACGNQHTLLLRANGTVVGLGSNRRGQTPLELQALVNIRQVAACWNTNAALSTDGDVHMFGNGAHGQLGHGPATDATLQYHTIQLDRTILQLAAGSEHVLVVSDGGDERQVIGWGWNEHGNLGLGHTLDILAPTCLWPPFELDGDAHHNKLRVESIWAGCGTSWISVTPTEHLSA
ncbi:RCC1/BLIP-II [Auriculariales sp. MPI-PUGE-AT-0066]|nr:RCC1/BLIP-II [Auriculariales sp. MPI-PUGE-AT-0066]